jgi:DNA-binding NtrC family response regulator
MSAPSILTITNSRKDAASLLSVLALEGWTTQWVSNCRDALSYLERHPPLLVLCESRGGWKTVMGALEVMENAPLLIVFPSRADRTLVTDALNSEGYQVQLKPFDWVEVENVLRTAILHAQVPIPGT